MSDDAKPGRVPWERWDEETAKHFHAFALYRDLLSQRSLQKVADVLAVERHGKKPEAARKARGIRRQLEGWSSKFSWVERAEAYDDFLDRRYREERESRIQRAEEDESRLASTVIWQLGRRVLGDRADVPEDQRVPRFDPRKVEERDVPALLEKAVRIRRLSDGQPTDVLRGNFSISMSEVSALFRDTFDILARHIPGERLERAQSELDAYLSTRQLPWSG